MGRPTGSVDVLLIGDSHANHFSGFVDELAMAANLRGYDITQSSTGFFPGTERWKVQNGKLSPVPNFLARNRYLERHLKITRYKVIVLAAEFPNYVDGLRDENGRSGVEVFERSFSSS